VEQHAEDFEGFLVTKKRVEQLDALEGERQRTVKEWCTFMVSAALEKPVQV
jgi:hypothetical protein